MKTTIWLVGSICLLTALSAQAQMSVGVAIGQLDDDTSGFDRNLKMAELNLGYTYNIGKSRFYLTPQLRLGTGISDNNFKLAEQQYTLELDSYVGASVRLSVDFSDKFSVMVQPTYAKADTTLSTSQAEVERGDWEFGYGAGIEYRPTLQWQWELMGETYDDQTLYSVGLRYFF